MLTLRTKILPLCMFSLLAYLIIFQFLFKEIKIIHLKKNSDILDIWIKQRRYKEKINCDSIFENNIEEIEKAKYYMKTNPLPKNDSLFIDLTHNCDIFRRKIGYEHVHNNSGFPIAYVISFYKNIEQMEFLLCTTYSPYNYYCIHADLSVSQVHM